MHPQTTPDAGISPVIVFGRDDQGKPHASRFDAVDAPLAEKAAGLMGMQVLRVTSDDEASLAATLPLGRIFASGRGFVPFVKADLFAKLAAAPNSFAPPSPADMPAKAPGKPKGRRSTAGGGDPTGNEAEAAGELAKLPTDRASIGVGSPVLAAEEDELTAFYVAKVIAQPGPDLFELQWRDWPDLPPIVRLRDHLALLPPGLAGTAG